MAIEKLNRQTKPLHEIYAGKKTKWKDRGCVSFERAAIDEAKEMDGTTFVKILVRCTSDPDDVRQFSVRRKPAEYIVEGLRGVE